MRLRPRRSNPAFRTQGGGREFRVGDRVVQGRNDYDKGVFNAEQGMVVAAGVPVRVRVRGEAAQRQGFVVQYPEGDGARRVEYSAGDAGDVSLAFACTVHKAQGSEYPHVVFAVAWDSFKLLERTLVYTAVSRARDTLTIVREQGRWSGRRRTARRRGDISGWVRLGARRHAVPPAWAERAGEE